jgi:hypothetical protein
MKIIDGWVKRESFPVKNKSACQEATGIGCNCLSESECMASKGRLRSKVETGFSSERIFPGNGQVVDPAIGGYVLVTSRNISQNPDIRSWHIR